MINFYVTPTSRLEYLLGKQLSYIAIGMINFFVLAAMARFVFGVPVKGSFLLLTVTTLFYVTATTGIGMMISTFTSSQVAAVLVTAILTITPTIQFSGLLQPVSTLMGNARIVGSIWPTSYYMHSSVGAYTKGLKAGLMLQDIVFLACSYRSSGLSACSASGSTRDRMNTLRNIFCLTASPLAEFSSYHLRDGGRLGMRHTRSCKPTTDRRHLTA